jgi:hypothetical protein
MSSFQSSQGAPPLPLRNREILNEDIAHVWYNENSFKKSPRAAHGGGTMAARSGLIQRQIFELLFPQRQQFKAKTF